MPRQIKVLATVTATTKRDGQARLAKKTSWVTACANICTKSTCTATTSAGHARPSNWSRIMKARMWKFTAIFSLSIAAMMSSVAARAENVQAETPWFSGVPLQSMVKGPAGTSINNTQLVWGTSLTVNSLAATGRGYVTVRLTDIGWPQALQSMSVLVSDLDSIWHKIDGSNANDLIFSMSGAAKLFVAVCAQSHD